MICQPRYHTLPMSGQFLLPVGAERGESSVGAITQSIRDLANPVPGGSRYSWVLAQAQAIPLSNGNRLDARCRAAWRAVELSASVLGEKTELA